MAGTIGHVILRSHAQLHSRGYDERQRNVQMAMRLAVVSDVALASCSCLCAGAGSLTPSEALSAIFGTIRHKKTLQSAGISPASRSPPPSSAGEHRPTRPALHGSFLARSGPALPACRWGDEPKTPASDNYLIVLYPHPEGYGRHAAPQTAPRRWPAARGSRSASRRWCPSAKSHTEPLRATQGPQRAAGGQPPWRPWSAGISTWTAPAAPAKRDEPAQGTPARHSHREKAP